MTPEPLAAGRVLVVGTGLIGTSVGLALTEVGIEVLLADRDPAAVALAADLGAGRTWDAKAAPDLVVVATPPPSVAAVAAQVVRRHPGALVTDVASVKVEPLEAMAAAGLAATYCGGHPVAGRERGGAASARPDLFDGRPWVLTPSAETSPRTVATAHWLALQCRATPVWGSAAEHDEALALVSHAPQALASLLAAQLAGAPALAPLVAGSGFRDTTRVAASDPQLWAAIIGANRAPVAAVLSAVRADLDRLLTALGGDAGTATAMVGDLVARGRAGRSRLPGKHGVPSPSFSVVPVLVDDAPGRLAGLLADAAAAGVNVEDLAIEHAPGRPRGVVELAVRPGEADRLALALGQGGWSVHRPAAEPSQ